MEINDSQRFKSKCNAQLAYLVHQKLPILGKTSFVDFPVCHILNWELLRPKELELIELMITDYNYLSNKEPYLRKIIHQFHILPIKSVSYPQIIFIHRNVLHKFSF